MRNVAINEAESIFETFWDCGESYPGHQKYNCLERYETENIGNAQIETMWCGLQISLNGTSEQYTVKAALKRKCELFVDEYDILRLFAIVPENMLVRISCIIDGKKETVIESFGRGSTGEYDGKISGKTITELKLEFEYCGMESSVAVLNWLGLSNKKKQTEMENRKSPYNDKWEGCFADSPDMKPQMGIYFDEKELKLIRQKIKKEPYYSMMEGLRAKAKEYLKIEPEKEIGTFMGNMDRRWLRDRDMKKTDIISPMERLAFVGIVDENEEMLKHACRMLLSIAHCTYWCESIMGVFPGATWHHRSFSEEMLCVACSKALDWAGGFLSWHGRNIVYDAIIMKGIPRLWADIKTMDYIWSMNQGIIFTSSLIITLIGLQKRYPRYETDLKEAEKSLFEMWENYCDKDGGVAEGASYWSYTMQTLSTAIRLLARNKNKTLAEYTPESIRRSGKYALCMLSDIDDGTTLIPINDTHINKTFEGVVSAFYAELLDDNRWKYLFKKSIDNRDISTELIIFGTDISKIADVRLEEEYVNLKYSGNVSLRRKDDRLGNVRLFIQNSPIIFSHTHEDKGSFILEAASKPILIDRGVCSYGESYVNVIGMASQHNLLIPERNGFVYKQNTTDPKRSGKTLEAVFSGKEFRYSVDLSQTWEENIFEKNIRSIFSDFPTTFIITDDIVCDKETLLSFKLNTYGKILQNGINYIIDCGDVKLRVEPVNWTPENVFANKNGVDGDGRIVNQLALYTGYVKECLLKTRLELYTD